MPIKQHISCCLPLGRPKRPKVTPNAAKTRPNQRHIEKGNSNNTLKIPLHKAKIAKTIERDGNQNRPLLSKVLCIHKNTKIVLFIVSYFHPHDK